LEANGQQRRETQCRPFSFGQLRKEPSSNRDTDPEHRWLAPRRWAANAVYELHGSTRRYFCQDCGKEYTLDEIEPHGVPHCSCGGVLKPDVVLYEEPFDEDMLMKAVDALRYSDVLIVGGTSLNVYPAAGLIQYFGGQTSIHHQQRRDR
jgi:NAD-dependent SIR2 family protein deacetylase